LRALAPEASVSTNFTTWAQGQPGNPRAMRLIWVAAVVNLGAYSVHGVQPLSVRISPPFERAKHRLPF